MKHNVANAPDPLVPLPQAAPSATGKLITAWDRARCVSISGRVATAVRSMRALFVAVLLIGILVGESKAKPSLTVACEAPKGPRIDFGTDRLAGVLRPELRTSEDSFTGVSPTFILDDKNPGMMTVLWGNTKLPGMPEEPVRAQEFPIVHHSTSQIVALESYANGAWVHSLYPRLGFGLFTKHSHWSTEDHAVGALLFAKCNFAHGD